MPAVIRHLSDRTVLAAIFALALLMRIPLFFGNFTNFDDGVLITKNPVIRSASIENAWLVLSTNFRGEFQNPMHLVNMLNLWVGQGTYASFVAFSIVWLWVTLLALDRFAALYIDRREARWLVVLAFAVHSVHLETLAWMSARCHWLGLPFALGSAIAWRRFRLGGGFGWYAVAFGSAVFAVFCKPIFISAPLFPLVDDWIARRRLSWRALAEHLPLFAYLAWRLGREPFLFGLKGIVEPIPLPWGITEGGVWVARLQFLGEYLLAAIVPEPTGLVARGLSGARLLGDGGFGLPMHASPPMLSVAALLAFSTALIALLRVHRAPLAWAVVGLAFLLPTMTARPHPPGAEFAFRYGLFPTLAVILGAGVALSALWPHLGMPRRRQLAAVIAVLLCLHAGRTVQMASNYASGHVWTQCVRAFPASDVCLQREIERLRRARDYPAAREMLEAWGQSRVAHPTLSRATNLDFELALIARGEERPEEERQHLERALRDRQIDPAFAAVIRERLREIEAPEPAHR